MRPAASAFVQHVRQVRVGRATAKKRGPGMLDGGVCQPLARLALACPFPSFQLGELYFFLFLQALFMCV